MENRSHGKIETCPNASSLIENLKTLIAEHGDLKIIPFVGDISIPDKHLPAYCLELGVTTAVQTGEKVFFLQATVL